MAPPQRPQPLARMVHAAGAQIRTPGDSQRAPRAVNKVSGAVNDSPREGCRQALLDLDCISSSARMEGTEEEGEPNLQRIIEAARIKAG